VGGAAATIVVVVVVVVQGTVVGIAVTVAVVAVAVDVAVVVAVVVGNGSVSAIARLDARRRFFDSSADVSDDGVTLGVAEKDGVDR
jgi:hypothetical protein